MSIKTFLKFPSKTTDNPINQQIYKLLLKSPTITSTEQGFELVRKDNRYIFIHEKLLLVYLVGKSCTKFQMLDDEFNESPAGFAVAPGRDYEAAFSK